MSEQYTFNDRTCATCAYWGGTRELKQYGDYLEVGSPMDRGICYSRDSGWSISQPTQACGSCSVWKKWEALR